jgi:N utilization substance protein B
MSYRRRAIREKVLQALYAYELSQEPVDQIFDYLFGEIKNESDALEFAKQLIYKVIENQKEIDAHIKSKVENWEFSRIALIDRLVLRMAICELLCFSDIPPKVSINEAIEIAKKYSTENSGKFVNGVLDAVLEDLRESKVMVKSGRGLNDRTEKRK